MTSPQERARRKLVVLITLIYLLLIFEGALRKWVLPSMGQALFFVRDPFVLLTYWLAFRHGFFPRGNAFLVTGVVFGFLAVLLSAAQILTAAGKMDGLLLLAGYGWRNYFLYIPLAFVIGNVLQRPDLERIVKLTLILAVPTAILVFLQFISPLDAPINVGFGGKGMQFIGNTLNQHHTRTMGFFTSDVGQKGFIVSAFAMALALWLAQAKRRFMKYWMLLPATAAVLSCLAVSGSRGSMVHCGIVMIAAMLCAVLVRSGGVSARAVVWPAVIGVAAVTLYPVLFPEGYTAFMGRWNAAAIEETRNSGLGIIGRALYGFVDFFTLFGDVPILGYGLGLAGNASITLGIEIPGFTGWAETDWARHMVDLGPFVGILFIVYRIAFTVWLGLHCLRGARRTGEPLPILLFAFVGIDLLYGQIAGHGSVNGYTWLFTGFCLAAAAWPASATERVPASEPPVPQPRFANLMR
jgi:hypothetical protein